MGELLSKLWCIYSMEYRAAIKVIFKDENLMMWRNSKVVKKKAEYKVAYNVELICKIIY